MSTPAATSSSPTATATNSNTKPSKNSNNNNKPTEFNPRWKGYLYILISSLVNFASVSNLDVEDDASFRGAYVFSLLLGIVTFLGAVLILVTDRFQYCCHNNNNNNNRDESSSSDNNNNNNRLNYTKSMDGKLEGYTLVTFTMWWIIGVGHITQVNGVAYVATNIYFSAWLALVACVYTLDKWSAAKDILSIRELTGLSATLKSWYLLFLASLVTMGTSCDLHIHVASTHQSSATYGIILGLGSSIVSLFFILVHYRLVDFEFLQLGGWMELSASFAMILLWVVGVSILTAEGGIAATIGGAGCGSVAKSPDGAGDFGEGCYVIWVPVQDPSTAPSMAPSRERSPPPIANNTESPTNPLPTKSPVIAPSPAVPGNTPVPTESTESARPTESQNNTLEPSTPTTTTLAPSAAATTEGSSIASSTLSPTAAESTFPPSEAPTVATTSSTETPTEAPVSVNSTITSAPVLDFGLVDITVNDDGARRLRSTQNVSTLNNTIDNSTDSLATIAPNTTDAPTPKPKPSSYPSYMPTSLPSDVPTNFPTFVEYDQRISCIDVLEEQIPGSNLYLAVWICFFASFNITLRWKAAQAIQFAQAQNMKASKKMREEEEEAENNGDGGKDTAGGDDGDDDDDDDDLAAEDDDL